jgi:hypothetical protein
MTDELRDELHGLKSLSRKVEEAEMVLKEALQRLDAASSDDPDLAFIQEAVTARFARLSDILLQKVYRALNRLEGLGAESRIDYFNLAEKKGWVESRDDLERIRSLRNEIAHEYAIRPIAELLDDVVTWSPVLLAGSQSTRRYATATIVKAER